MNSPKYHRLEKWLYRSFFLFIVLIIPMLVLYVVANDSIYTTVVVWAVRVALIASVLFYLALNLKTANWMREGRELTNELDLKRILLMEGKYEDRPSDLRVIEIHHYLGPFSEGKAYSKRDRKEVLDEFKAQLKVDFEKLAEWKREQQANGQRILILMSTHPAMMKTYERTSKEHFSIVKAKKVLDPYVGMNLYEWATATYLTSGRWGFKAPKQWDGYYFYLHEELPNGEEYIK